MIMWARGGVREGDGMFASCSCWILLPVGARQNMRSSICNASILFYVVLRASFVHEHSLKSRLEIVI
uniref:Uncharacterized protein n=1 Tax=Arundo donax TaxID=35708 RepID=A0A0A9FGX0_ARUDO